jgi:hypothetical protein
MFGSDNNFFNGISLSNAYNVASPSLVNYLADFTVIAFVGHPLMDARVYFNDYGVARLIFV